MKSKMPVHVVSDATGRRRGRPSTSDTDAAAKAVRIIDIAVALHNGQRGRLASMGVTPQQAARLVSVRHRGRVGAFIGDSVIALFPGSNPTAAAARLVLDHGLSINAAARAMRKTAGGLDRANVSRAVQKERERRAAALTAGGANFLPGNTLP